MILDELAESAFERVRKCKRERDTASLRRDAEQLGAGGGALFAEAMKKPGISFICEVKRASPSKGMIAEDFPYRAIAREYEDAGARAISVLTEPFYFKGNDRYLEEIAGDVKVPVLRKDFTVDAYQIFEARLLGASAVLFICAILSEGQIREYLEVARSLGLSALVEAHTEGEAETALRAGAEIIGVNNRDLKTFQVDLSTSLRLRQMIPEEIPFVSESGIRTPQDVARLREKKVDAVLVGETLMRCADKKRELQLLNGSCGKEAG